MRQRTRSGARAAALGLSLALLLAACGSGDDDTATDDAEPAAPSEGSAGVDPAPAPLDERAELTVTVPTRIEGFADLLLADHFGEFEAENLDVSIEVLPGSEAIVLLGSGESDINYGSANASFFNSLAEGLDIRWLSSTYVPNPESRAGLWVSNERLGDDGELSADEAEGMTVALGQLGFSAPTGPLLIDYLDELGLDSSDVTSSPLQGAEMLMALENGGVDAAYVLDPFWQELEGDDTATFVEGFPDAALGGAFAGPVRDESPEVVDAFLRAIVRTHRAYLSGDYHQDAEVVDALAEIIGVTPEDITRNPPLVWPEDPVVGDEGVSLLQDAWIGADVLDYDEPLAFEDVVDPAPLERVLEGSGS